jgi:asparagine synthase (glutamine-hydrolysing)
MPSKIFGFFRQESDTFDKDAALRHARELVPLAASTVELPTGLGFSGLFAGEHVAHSGSLAAVVSGSPTWKNPGESSSTNPASAVLAGYERHGERFLAQIRGRFALALVDGKSRTALLALDPMGMERLTYSWRDQTLTFSDSASSVARFSPDGARLRNQALFDYLLLHMVPAPETVYEGVLKLRPGTVARFANGSLKTERFWTPHFSEAGTEGFPAYKSELQSSLRRAVEESQPDATTGAFLSGGLDSSSVAGMLSKVRPGSRTFSIGFGVDAYDELSYARIAVRQFHTNSIEYHVTPEDIVTAFLKIAAAYDEPFGNSSAVPTYACARLAADHGITHLLAGDGGDEIFGGNERYVRQRVFEQYYRLPGALRRAVVHPLSRLISPDSALTPLRKFRSYVDQASIRLPERLETWNLVYREGAAKLLDPEFLRAIDSRAPFQRMQEVYDENVDASMLNKMLFYDWQYTLSDNDLRKVGAMCDLAGVKVSYPMLHPDVVDLSLRVPSAMKIEGNELRSFYKKAMGDFLPREIIEKKKHGFGLPFGVWLKTHRGLGELIFGHLESLRRRHIVSSSFIDEIVAGHRTGDASFYGYPIWDMAMLDAWLTAHDVRP